MTHIQRLRALLATGDLVLAPGMYDAMTALLVERHGFDVAYMGGGNMSYTRIGRPDIGLMSLGEVGDAIARVRERIDIPLVTDLDTGFGNALNTQRAVRLFEQMGASGAHLEDQTYPKRCGHLAGKALVPVGEMVGKIKAALDARRQDMVLIARTDAIAVEGFDRALDRGEAYLEAGADMLFIEAPQTMAQLQGIAARFAGRVPLLANMVEGGRTPQLSGPALHAMGFAFVILPGAMMRVTTWAANQYLEVLKAEGGTASLKDRMFDFPGLNAILGIDALMEDGLRFDGTLADARDLRGEQS